MNSADIPQDFIDEFVGVAHGDFNRVKELLDRYPDLVNARAQWQETAVQAAAQTGNEQIARYLLDRGAPLDICTAAMLGDAGAVRSMLAGDASLVKATGAHGIPVIYFPVLHGHREIAQFLLENGAEINGGEGVSTPLHGAVAFNQPEMAAWLLEHGARRDLLDYAGKTPLQVAEENGQDEIAALLRSKA